MAQLNETFRNKSRTDRCALLSGKWRPPERGPNMSGDIAISPETARRNARRFSRSLPLELRILILHGMIHLAGFDHEADHGEMDRLERRLRKRWDVGPAR